jgi:hypothetical protein
MAAPRQTILSVVVALAALALVVCPAVFAAVVLVEVAPLVV